MVMKCAVVSLVAVALFGSFCGAVWDPSKYQRPTIPNQNTKQISENPQQHKQSFEKPLTWSYPEAPTPPPQPEAPFELRHPVPVASVAVECREKDAHVEVMKDMFGIGQYINPADLTMGECGAVGEDTAAQVLIYEAELHECGSTLMMTEDSLIYTFTMNYNPKALGSSPVLRTSPAVVIVECHYPRKHNVSTGPLDPLWIPFSAVKVSEEFLYFSLKLMTDNFQAMRASYQYFLGDLILIEASVMQFNHVPLRVYVDSCVASLSPDSNSDPKYAFIENHGCFVDAKITGSRSQFLARSIENKLHFQLEAFRFQGADSGLLYITCQLKASSAAYDLDDEHKACSYVNGWREASGADVHCGTCDSGAYGPVSTSSGASGASSGGSWSHPSHSGRKSRDVKTPNFEWQGKVSVGPIHIE